MEQEANREAFERDIREAMPYTNIPTLLLLLHQFTGEDRWLKDPFQPERSRGLDDNDSGGLSPEIQAQIREAAVQAILAWKGGSAVAKPSLSGDELIQMMTVTEAEPIPADYASVMADKLVRYAGYAPERISVPEGFRVLIVGAGMSGVAAAIKLAQAGVPHTIIEKQDRAGGVWSSHRYPGCGVDTPGHLYSYTFAPGNWATYFPLQEEIQGYFHRVAEESGVADRVRFGTECLTSRYDEESHTWHSLLRNPDGTEETLVSNVVITGVGTFTTPKLPAIPGLETFDGPVVHTARWDSDVELEGKRVAVIGNGASAMQLVPAIADTVEHLSIFQRSKQWAAPFSKFHKKVPEPLRFFLREVPHYEWLYRLRLSWIFDSAVYDALQKDPEWPHPERSMNAINDRHRRFFTRYINEQLEGRPDLIEKVTPDFPPFGKRMLLDNGWYKAVARPDVTLIDEAVARIDGNRIHGVGGQVVEADVLILATGYDVVRYLSPVELIGRGGVSIREAWDDVDSRAYLGTVVPGFPNFFMLYGPNTQLGHGGSFIYIVECQIDYVLSVLRAMSETSVDVVECREDVYDKYNETIQSMHQNMIWSHPGMSTYFRNERGRIITQNPWKLPDFWALTREANLDSDYITVQQVAELERA
ncbi:NAD(P)/FAD-dependent oxidoreductase [Arthrobacter sp. M4]|uniref:flavin-containing monooxygenase n=1 Tax=Arthrobacter sp. M4 TaxID=218160 RepID=UPI001CDC92B8|nr:NAD(P)/FAD-dependent oxidoreductase [Arthrobacter sp. M4]MCA4135384.1 NAD(P)/FAD-dependent oxidoreductase [Arthrobacter sp. M4]